MATPREKQLVILLLKERLQRSTGKQVILQEARVDNKDWERMLELVLKRNDGKGVAATITNKDKAIARYVAGLKLNGDSINISQSGNYYYGDFSAFAERARELGATAEEIQTVFDQTTVPPQYADKLKNLSSKGLSSYAGPISKLILDMGLDIKFTKSGGNALTMTGKDAMSRNGRNWTMGYVAEVTLQNGTVIPFSFDAVTDEGGTRPTLYITDRLGNISGSYDQPVGIREYLTRVKAALEKEIAKQPQTQAPVMAESKKAKLSRLLKEGLQRVSIEQMNDILTKTPPQEKIALYMITTVVMNKNYVDENGNKVANPYYDKVKKKNIVYGRVNYSYGEEFKGATGGEHVPTPGRTLGEKQGAITVKDGRARLPLTDVEYDTPTFEINGNPISKEELTPYLKPASGSPVPSGVRMIAPYLDNVKSISIGNNEYQVI